MSVIYYIVYLFFIYLIIKKNFLKLRYLNKLLLLIFLIVVVKFNQIYYHLF